MQKLNQFYIKSVVKKALEEDLRPRGDITTSLINSKNKIIAKFFSSSDNIEIENTIIYQNSERYVSKQIVILVELKKIRELNKLITKWSLKFEK